MTTSTAEHTAEQDLPAFPKTRTHVSLEGAGRLAIVERSDNGRINVHSWHNFVRMDLVSAAPYFSAGSHLTPTEARATAAALIEAADFAEGKSGEIAA